MFKKLIPLTNVGLIGPIQQVPVDCEQAQLVVPHEFLVETKKLLRQIQMPTIRVHHHL